MHSVPLLTSHLHCNLVHLFLTPLTHLFYWGFFLSFFLSFQSLFLSLRLKFFWEQKNIKYYVSRTTANCIWECNKLWFMRCFLRLCKIKLNCCNYFLTNVISFVYCRCWYNDSQVIFLTYVCPIALCILVRNNFLSWIHIYAIHVQVSIHSSRFQADLQWPVLVAMTCVSCNDLCLLQWSVLVAMICVGCNDLCWLQWSVLVAMICVGCNDLCCCERIIFTGGVRLGHQITLYDP
jgi:hypothetical protein